MGYNQGNKPVKTAFFPMNSIGFQRVAKMLHGQLQRGWQSNLRLMGAGGIHFYFAVERASFRDSR